jgi:ubiquinone/menaquinone biosynthesis C-methylase UbiE
MEILEHDGALVSGGDAADEADVTRPFYLMESPREGARLEAKTDQAAAERQLRWAGLRPGAHALDVGCGTGAVTRVMAELVGRTGHVVGVDASADRLELARQLANEHALEIDFKQGDAHQLPLLANSVDYSWTRFLFQYLADPLSVVGELCRVTAPGGTVVVGDLDGQLDQMYPFDESVRADLLDGLRILGARGFDPHVGRKLYHWLHQAGLVDIRIDVTPYQVYTSALPERDLVNWREKLLTATDTLTKLTGERERWERLREGYLAQLQRHDTFYYCTLILVCGTVPVT